MCYCSLQRQTIKHLSHDIQQSMCYSYFQNRKPAVTDHSNSQYWGRYSRWRHGTSFWAWPLPCVPTHAQKAFNFELWLLVKAVFYNVEKTVGKSAKQLISLDCCLILEETQSKYSNRAVLELKNNATKIAWVLGKKHFLWLLSVQKVGATLRIEHHQLISLLCNIKLILSLNRH